MDVKNKKFKKIVKPCRLCGYCPYGQSAKKYKIDNSNGSCKVYGHQCPAFYQAEPFIDEGEVSDRQMEAMFKEFEQIYNDIGAD